MSLGKSRATTTVSVKLQLVYQIPAKMNRYGIENEIKNVILSDKKLLHPNEAICYEAKYRNGASTTSIYYKMTLKSNS